ncbi:MAG: alpha/beta hydrolase [Myxococcota bacterium]
MTGKSLLASIALTGILLTIAGIQTDTTAHAELRKSDSADKLKGEIININGIDLFVVDQGQGPAVLLLHGFPDSSELWRHQIPSLVDAGFRIIAPDLRGFGQSARPEGVEAYQVPVILGDLVGLLDHFGVDRAHVVGHDWGAAIAWSLAAFIPDRVDHLVALSVGHGNAFGDPSDIEQRRMSWYMLYFQFEGVAEAQLPRDDWALWRASFGEHPEQDTWFADLSRPGALTAALNYYRANLRPQPEPGTPQPSVVAPTMGIWSSGDVALGERQMTESANFASTSFRYERIEGASHWIPLDAPEQVTALLLDFLPCPDPSGADCATSEPGDDDPSADEPQPDGETPPISEDSGCSTAPGSPSTPVTATWMFLLLGTLSLLWLHLRAHRRSREQ